MAASKDFEDSSMPHFVIDRSLFEIEYRDIKLLKEIGAGGSGAVICLGKWHEQQVAIKLFRTSTFSGDMDFKEFERELQFIGSLRHPNILLFYGAVLVPPRVGIVTEFCPHGTLATYIKAQATLS